MALEFSVGPGSAAAASSAVVGHLRFFSSRITSP
jgi:hypothetical protein